MSHREDSKLLMLKSKAVDVVVKKKKKKTQVVVDVVDAGEVKRVVVVERKTNPISLLTDAYAPATVKKYHKAVVDFVRWCNDEGVPAISSWLEMDETMFAYFADMYVMKMDGHPDAKGGKSKAADTYNGVLMYLPRGRFELLTAAKAIRNWNRIEVSVSYPPITKNICLVVAVYLMRTGYERYAVGTLLAFDCLLRVGELVNIHYEDVADVADSRYDSGNNEMSILLRKTKTGPNQFVVVRSPVVIELVRRLILKTGKDARLFSFTTAQFRKVFKDACSKLGLKAGYVPHSLRHGGATHLHGVEKMKVEDVMVHGRWAALKSAKRYIQTGRALLTNIKISSDIVEISSAYAKNPLAALDLAKKRFSSSSSSSR